MRRLSKKRKTTLMIIGYAVFIVINFPIIALVLNSLKSPAELLSGAHLIPRAPTMENFVNVFQRSQFPTFLLNSFIVVSVATVLSIAIAAMSGYAVSRWRRGIFRAYSQSLLLLQMFPIILVVLPIFMLFQQVGLVDSLASVIIIYTTLHLPFAVWMFKGFFDTVPRELEDAGIIDGCTRTQVFLRVVMPLAGPGITSVGIFSYLFAWNEFFVASVFLRSTDTRTIPVGIQVFIAQTRTDWGTLLAAAVTAMIPTLILFLFLQKRFVSGGLAGSVKG